MKRFIFLITFTCLTAWIPMACSHTITGPVPTVQAPTATATITTQPVCGFTPIPTASLTGYGNFTAPQSSNVIQTAAAWATVNPHYSQPSVNFSNQMILEYTEPLGVSCMCTFVQPVITSVCFYSDHIEVTGTKASINYPTLAPGAPQCQSFALLQAMVLVAVPQSNLPVVWNMQ